MKIAVCVHYQPKEKGRNPLQEGRQLALSIALLRRRAVMLCDMACQPVVLGQVDSVVEAVRECRRLGIEHLWVSFASTARPLRYEYLRNPLLLQGISLYADGLISPDLPPTAGQLERLSAMGITYLEGEGPVAEVFSSTSALSQ